MYGTPVIIGKISLDRANRTSTWSGGVLLHPERACFRQWPALYIIPLITQIHAKTKKWLHTVCLFRIYLFPAFVELISREIVRQRRWRHLQRNTLGLMSYRTTCRVILKTGVRDKKFTFLDSGRYMLSNGHYWKIIHHRKSGWPMQVNGAFHSIEKSCVIIYYNIVFYVFWYLLTFCIYIYFLLP